MIDVAAPDQAWNEWVEHAAGEGDFLQTGWWAEIDRAANGATSHVVRGRSGIGGLVSHSGDGDGEMRCFHGPVIADPEALDELDAFAACVEQLARDACCGHVRFIGRPVTSAIPAERIAEALAARGYKTSPWLTSVVDLDGTDEQLLARADRAVAKALRRCAREGVTVLECSDRDSYESRFLRAFAEVRSDFDLERGRAAFAADQLRHYRYYVAVDAGGTTLATLGTYRFAGVATEIMSVRTAPGREQGAPAQDLLHWRAMCDHRELGDLWFDLAGYSPLPSTPAEAGIRRFKEKWGGREVPSPTFSKAFGGARVRRAARSIVSRHVLRRPRPEASNAG